MVPPCPATAATLSDLAVGILGIYEALAPAAACPGDTSAVRLSAIRDLLGRVDDAELHAAYIELADLDDVYLREEVNQQHLTAADRAAAIRLGGEDRHNLQVAPELLAQLD